MTKKIRRSWLLVPMSKPARIAEAAHAGADAVVLDLAELVVEADRPAARTNVQAAIKSVQAGGAEVFAQIDLAALEDDLHACVWPGLTGVVLTRAESAEQIVDVAAMLSSSLKLRASSRPERWRSLRQLKPRAEIHAAHSNT